MQRVLVIGNSGAGKSTLARALSQRLDARWVELDALFWGPDWTPRPREAFSAAVLQATQGERWVADGNYGGVRELLWPMADTVVWLDYALPRVLWRGLWRTLRRAITREPLWSDNHESLRKSFLSRDSILWWIVTTHARRHREFAALRDAGPYADKAWLVQRSPRETARWLAALPQRDLD